MEEKYEFEFEPSKPLDGKGVTFASPVTSKPESKGDPLNFPPAKKIADEVLNSASNLGANAIAGGVGATAGFLARTAEIRKVFEILTEKGVPPEQAINLATKQVLSVGAGLPGAASYPTTSITLASDIRAKDPNASGAVNYGNKMPGQVLPNVVAATIEDMTTGKNPRGLGAGDVAARDAAARQKIKEMGEGGVRLYVLKNGEQFLLHPEQAAALNKDLEEKNKPSKTQRIMNVFKPDPSTLSKVSNLAGWSATTPGIAGKGLGIGLGGFAGYQGSKAYNDFNEAKNDYDKVSAATDMLSAFGSGVAALPIPRAQIPGLALAAGIPALKYGANKMFGSPAKAADYPSAYPEKESDDVGEALTAGQLAAGLAAVYPPAAPVAIPVGLGLGAIDFARRGGKKEAILNAEKIRKFESLGDPTEEEIQEAINSGAYRQRIRGRR